MKTLFCIALLTIPVPLLAIEATPEPASIAMIGVGFAGLGLVAWRRNRKR